MTHVLRAVAASLLAGWLLAPAAHADLTWSSTQTLSTDATNGAGPALAFDATGGAVAAWLETDSGGHSRVHVATRAAHGFLGPAATVSAAGTDAYGVRVVVARDGAAYVLWGQRNAATGADIYVLSRPAGGAFGPPQNATETDGAASLGDAVVNNANDRLLMAYSQLDTTTGPPAQVEERVKRVTTAGAVSGFIKIAEVTASDVNHDPLIGQQDLAMDANGNALLAWADNPNSWNQDRDQAYVRAARLDANGNPLEAAQQVGVRVGRSIDDPVAAINDARSVVLWNKTTGAGRGEADYVTRTGTGTGAWSGFKTPISNDYDNDPNFFRSVVSDAAGDLTATYGRGFDAAPANGDLSMDASALYFGATRPFADPADSARLFAVDDSGTSSYYRLGANRHVSIGTRAPGPGGAYSTPVDVATLPQQQRPVVAAGPDGTTGVMWVDSDGENDRVFVRFGDIAVPAGPGTTPGPADGPPPPPALPLPLPPPPPAAPVPSAIQVVQKFTSGHAGVLTVAFTGEASQIEWTVGKNGPTYSATASQRSIRLRLTGPATVTAKVTGPGGAQTFTRSVSGQARPDDADAKKVLGGEPRDASAVVATGAESVLTGKSSACGAVNVRSGGVTLSGCMRPLDELADLPGAERGVLDPIASAYGLNRSDAGLMGRAIELLDGYAATGTVLINGLWPVTPAGGAGVMAFPQASALTSSNASVRVAGTALKPAGGGFNLKVGSSAGAIDLGAIPRPVSFPQLGRFPYVGDFNVSLGGGYATIQTGIKLPDFVQRNGINVQPRMQIYASPDGLSSVDGVKMGPMDVAFGPVVLDDLTVRYDQASDQWIGGMSACLFGAGCLDFKDPVGSIRLQGNELVYAKTGLVFADPGKPLAPPAVYLNHANLGFGLNPSRVFGQAGITGGGFVKVDGYEVFAAPSSATPYLLKRDEVGQSFPAAMYSTPFTRPLVAAGGDVGLDLPFVGDTRLGGGYFLYELPGYVAIGGNASFDLLGIIRFGGGINGEMDLVKQRYNLHGDISACLIAVDDDLCARSVANISRGPNLEGGSGACLQLGPVSAGGGVQWAHPDKPFIWPIDGCKWSPFKIDVRAGQARAAQAAGTTVQMGATAQAIQLDGSGESPQVKVTGPHGETLDTSAGRFVYSPDAKIRIVRFDNADAHFTTVGLQGVAAGAWRIEPLPGSATIVGTSIAKNPADAKVSGRVTRGRGDRRVLTFDVRRRPAQRVQFFDVDRRGARRLIGITPGGHGSIAFTPGPDQAKHTVVASIALNGIGSEERTVTTFTPPPPVLAAPRGLDVRRKGTSVRVTWRDVPGATGYELALTAGTQRFATSHARVLVFKNVSKTTGGRVTVRAVGNYRQSKVTRVSFKRLVQKKQPLRSLKKCSVRKKRIRCH
ncbi:MAG TPA: hypothetical protein VFG42_13780 [Baekduia sp.]|uniref:hypothetical protein n=1 Tax=Baekduia sp. TaxID=2600305 RepID=UPI002D768A62|nr:hypothetical protein [Baekduia sp.]HET6507854.1 hypothetical protein [Baekduia sp.]